MKIKKYDVFDVYQDGCETFRAIALGYFDDEYIDVVLIEDLTSGYGIRRDFSVARVHVETEIEKVLFNLMEER